MSTAILALEDVTVAYHGDITILNRINVQAREGKVTGVIGPQRRRQVHGAQNPVWLPAAAHRPHHPARQGHQRSALA